MRGIAIIPAYNEEASLPFTIEEFQREAPDFDFVIINDGSRDLTLKECQENGWPTINLMVNTGLSSAFHTGMKYAYEAGYDVAVQFDADGQHMPQFLAPMAERMAKENLDVLIGSRFVVAPKDMSARMIGSRFLTALIKLVCHKQINDPTSGLRMYSRRVIEQFAQDPTFVPEPDTLVRLVNMGMNLAEHQVTMRERVAGESYLTITRSIRYMLSHTFSILLLQRGRN